MSNESSIEMAILYEDADCVVADKPSGLMVHPDGRSAGPFLTDWILAHYPEAAAVGEPSRTPEGETIIRPGIVHRLDRDTSGAIVIAKTQAAYEFLKTQFQDRLVTKKYLAFVWGEMKEEFGTITRPIGRNAREFKKWSAQRGARGEMREAETYWTRLWTGSAPVTEEGGAEKVEKFSLLQAEPKTGRTHQIRVHFLALHHPVVSDILYATKKPRALGFERTALHARSIEFTAPSGAKVKVQAPLPADFDNAVRTLGITLK